MYTVLMYGNRHAPAIFKAVADCKGIALRWAPIFGPAMGHIALFDAPRRPPVGPLRCQVGIAPGNDPLALDFFKANHVPVITVGRSQRDTLTLSSRRERSAVISLQRELRTLLGQTLGPAEYPLPCLPPWDDTALLYAAALLLLCGQESTLLSPAPPCGQNLSTP